MDRYYCTYFDANYLSRGVALIRSLILQETRPWTLYVVCLDEITRVVLEKLAFEGVLCIPLHQLEKGDKALLSAKSNRSTTEYYWTLTPTILQRIFEWMPHIEALTYLDSDLFFFSAPQPIFDEFANYSVLIHGHRFPQRLKPLEVGSGKYNVGLLCFRNDPNGRRVLNWWRDKCNEWCYARVEAGKYGDQAYLNSWLNEFEGVGVLQHLGAGLAPWNYEQYSIVPSPAGSQEPATVNNLPVVFYHFHGFQMPYQNIYIPIKKGTVYALSQNVLLGCYWPYIRHLHESIRDISKHYFCRYEVTLPDLITSDITTFLFPSSLAALLESCTREHTSMELPFGWSCFISQKQPVLNW
jgi:hypothetical protein